MHIKKTQASKQANKQNPKPNKHKQTTSKKTQQPPPPKKPKHHQNLSE